MAKKHVENRKTAMLQAFLCLIGTVVLYVFVFSNLDFITKVIRSQTYYAPLITVVIVLAASFLYGTATSKILKHTLEKRLKSQELREE